VRWNWICILVATIVIHVGAVAAFGHEADDDAEEAGPRNWHELLRDWEWEPGSYIGLAVAAALYGAGVGRLWRNAGIGHGARLSEVTSFVAGWLTLFVALVSPLHPWGSVLFSVHMVQHELLMLFAAPLLVLARPMPVMLHALPNAWSHGLGALSNSTWWRYIWRGITHPMMAWLIHFCVLWGWHLPVLFQATQHSEWVHAAQHASFIIAALLFWWSLIHARRGAAAYGAGVLYLFTTALYSGLLGALLTLTKTLWYPIYVGRTNAWGITPEQDQALGGLIMWIPACTIYILAGLIMFAKWLRESDRPNRSLIAPRRTHRERP
jgi:putative membrane protein